MENLTTDLMMIAAYHHEYSSGTNVDGLHASKTEIKFEVDENKKIKNGCQVNLHENGTGMEKMTESIVNNGSSPIQFTTADPNLVGEFPNCFSPSCDFNNEIPKDGTGDSHMEQKVLEELGMIEQVSSQSDHREPAADISVSNFPILDEKSQNVGWDQSMLLTETKDNRTSSIIESKQEKCYDEVDASKIHN
ncbi:hypothetical protein Scep_009762 [Stephania cephalantha]|uniref:Uncharacterized protein n=1 Tax=Stephania cephalantha TaxID=152367 RepID=A0AAP0PGK3_9MAGN